MIYIETNIIVNEENLGCSGTNPRKERRCTQTFMQTMLSNYETIDEILAHIDDYDWFDLEKIGFCQSFLLADNSGRSVVIEFAEDSWEEQIENYCWESTFITVANLSDLQLNVHFSEHYGVEFKVSLEK